MKTRSQTKDIHAGFLSELSLPKILVLIALRRDVRLLGVNSLIPPLKGVLNRVQNWALQSGHATLAIKEFSDLGPFWEYSTLVYCRDVFRKVEKWQNDYLGFKELVGDKSAYAEAYRLAACKYFHWKYVSMFLLNAVVSERPDWKLFGVPKDLLGLCAHYFSTRDFSHLRPQRQPTRLVNTALAIMTILYGASWALLRIRALVKVEDVFLAADSINDERDRYLFDEVSDGGPVLMVMRNQSLLDDVSLVFSQFPKCQIKDGFLPLGEGLKAVWHITVGVFHLFRRHGHVDPDLFFQVASFPVREIFYRALFRRFRPKYFWGRDDYQIEHILRRNELHQVGAKSFGISHGIPSICILMPPFRYISFDNYYLLAGVIEPYYRETWADDMAVKVSGSFGFSREQLVRPPSQSKRILIMSRYAVGHPEFIKTARMLAVFLPDYEILLQFKTGYAHDKLIPGIVKASSEGVTNVRLTTEPVYDLLLNVTCIVSDASTVVSEALQINVPIFVLDVIEKHETFPYRDFDGLCHRSADSISKAVSDLINSDSTYPFEKYSGLFNSSDISIYDMIRTDMGLPPLEDTNG